MGGGRTAPRLPPLREWPEPRTALGAGSGQEEQSDRRCRSRRRAVRFVPVGGAAPRDAAAVVPASWRSGAAALVSEFLEQTMPRPEIAKHIGNIVFL